MYNELTKVDIEKMKEEIEYRKTVLDPPLREALKEARELGDLSENDEYRTAKRELGHNRSRIRYLENMIRTAIVISTDSEADTVGLFDEVDIYFEEEDSTETMRIVTTLRNDVFNNCISKDSPFGMAVIGRKAGDRVFVKVNDNYSYPVVIKAIRKGIDDPNIPINKY